MVRIRVLNCVRAFLVALSALAYSGIPLGQASFEAQIRGVVRDASGSVIVGAKVTITDLATNSSNSVITDGRGAYSFNGLRRATYQVKTEMAGFRSEEAKNVVLAVNQRADLDFSLQVGGTESSITIVEAAPTLDTGSAEIGTTVSGRY